MAKNNQSANPEKKNFFAKWLGPIFGALFSIFWVTFIIMGTLWLVGALTLTAPADEALIERIMLIIWPSVVLALGVPVLVAIWFGGAEALTRLRDLRKHLSQLDTYVTFFQELEISAEKVNSQLSASSEEVGRATNSMSSSLDAFQKLNDSFERNIDLLSPQETALALERVDSDVNDAIGGIQGQFYKAFYRANDIFYEVLERRNDNPGQGKRQLIVGQGGLNKDQLVRKLYDENQLSNRVFDVLHRIFSMEKSSRWQGRTNLDEFEVHSALSDIETLTPEDWQKSR